MCRTTAEVVSDEQIGQTKFSACKSFKQIDGSALGSKTSSAERFVTQNQNPAAPESTRDPNALTLPPLNFVRVPIRNRGFNPTQLHQTQHFDLRSRPRQRNCTTKRFSMIATDPSFADSMTQTDLEKNHLHAPGDRQHRRGPKATRDRTRPSTSTSPLVGRTK